MTHAGLYDTMIVCIEAYLLTGITIYNVKQSSLQHDYFYPSSPLG